MLKLQSHPAVWRLRVAVSEYETLNSGLGAPPFLPSFTDPESGHLKVAAGLAQAEHWLKRVI